VREGQGRLAALIDDYLRSPELSEKARNLLKEAKSCLGNPSTEKPSDGLRALASD